MALFDKSLAELGFQPMIMISEDDSLRSAIKFFYDHRIGAVGVKNSDGKMSGIISERDMILRVDPEQFTHIDDLHVKDIMTKKVFSISEASSLSDALELMAKLEFRHLPIKNDRGDFKMMSARDILMLLIERYTSVCDQFGTLTTWDTNVGHIHEENFVYRGEKNTLETGSFLFASLKDIGGSDMLRVDEDLPIIELWRAMRAAHLPVTSVTKWSTLLSGVIPERDLLRKVLGSQAATLEDPVSKIMTPNPHSMLLKHHLVFALNNMSKFKYRNILIVDEDRYPIKIAELVDFLKFFRRVIQSVQN